MVECQLPKLDVAGSSPVSRSKINNLQGLPDVLCAVLLRNSDPAYASENRRTDEVQHPEVCIHCSRLRSG